eukprot:Lithocolla_globosa_v1_NODE_1957_length_2240_cov_8.177117.p1 type:complete len:507 gc:universal NODE_1957_length_2240_cov_8.177117:586-2106(+)
MDNMELDNMEDVQDEINNEESEGDYDGSSKHPQLQDEINNEESEGEDDQEEAQPGSSKHPQLHVSNFTFTYHTSTKSHDKYRCCKRRSKKCHASMWVNKLTGMHAFKGEHNCIEQSTTEPDVVDVRQEMADLASDRAITELQKSPTKIWDEINLLIMTKYPDKVLIKPRKDYLCNLISNRRRDQGHGDITTALTSDEWARVGGGDSRLFLRYMFTYELKDRKGVTDLHKMYIWAHPSLVWYLKYPGSHAFFDGTFWCVPKPFTQALVCMVYDHATEVYVPVVYGLVDNKMENTYWHFCHFVVVISDFKFEPATTGIDFEKGWINAVRSQFPKTKVIGCLFHFKQALRRKMLALRIPVDDVKVTMEKGMIDVLTMVTEKQIKTTIAFLRTQINEKGSVSKWNTFWAYFERTWMTEFAFDTWNVSGLDLDDVLNRTSGALENFNRKLGGRFPTHHPNLFSFVEVIKAVSDEYVRLLTEILAGNADSPNRTTPTPIIIPSELQARLQLE